jgi:putative tricarboxylic transport membrane protein
MLTILFGVVGYLLVQYRFPIAAVVLGIVLGPILEVNLRNALIGSDMDFTVFVTRPISAVTLAATLVLILIWSRRKKGVEAAQGSAAAGT